MKETHDNCLECSKTMPEARKKFHAKFCTKKCWKEYHKRVDTIYRMNISLTSDKEHQEILATAELLDKSASLIVREHFKDLRKRLRAKI